MLDVVGCVCVNACMLYTPFLHRYVCFGAYALLEDGRFVVVLRARGLNRDSKATLMELHKHITHIHTHTQADDTQLRENRVDLVASRGIKVDLSLMQIRFSLSTYMYEYIHMFSTNSEALLIFSSRLCCVSVCVRVYNHSFYLHKHMCVSAYVCVCVRVCLCMAVHVEEYYL